METALITGTSSGIGLATARSRAQRTPRVRGHAQPRQGRPAARSGGGGRPAGRGDRARRHLAESVATAAVAGARGGTVDVLVNNAGVGGATPLELTPEAEHRQMFETNYFGAVRCIQAVLPAMRERRTRRDRQRHIDRRPGATPNQIPYSASKWALECLGEALAHEVRRFGIRVVNIEPGVIMTHIFDELVGGDALRQDLALPADHAAQRQVLRRRIRVPRRSPSPSPRPSSKRSPRRTIACAGRSATMRWLLRRAAEISDEDWVALGDDLSDEEYNRRFYEYFGIRL